MIYPLEAQGSRVLVAFGADLQQTYGRLALKAFRDVDLRLRMPPCIHL